MLNYRTNVRNGALVRFNPAVRSNPTPRLASPRCPPARFQARTILPSPAFPSPAPSRFISHPTSQLRPAPCSVPRPRRASPPGTVLGFFPGSRLRPPPCSVSFPVGVSALHRAWFRGPAPVSALTVLDFAATASPAFPAILGFAARPVCGPDRVWFRVPLRSAATPFGSKAPSPSDFGFRSCLQAFRLCSPTASHVR